MSTPTRSGAPISTSTASSGVARSGSRRSQRPAGAPAAAAASAPQSAAPRQTPKAQNTVPSVAASRPTQGGGQQALSRSRGPQNPAGGAAAGERRSGGRGRSAASTPAAQAQATRHAQDKQDRREARGTTRPQAQQRGSRPATVDLFSRQQIAVPNDRSFTELGVAPALLPTLTALGAVSPFPIQSATLEATLAGRDVLGRGRTGSGKTLAFALPLVSRLAGGRRTPHKPRGLVLLPTRELALQVDRTVAPLAKALGLKTTVIFGGVGYGPQTTALRQGVDIVIACPGRLEDLRNTGVVDLSSVEVTVLDEADHMADLGFLPGVRRLLGATAPTGQRLLFSATLDNGISVIVNDFLTDPAVYAVDDETSPVEALTHHVFAVSADHRTEVVRQLAAGGERRLLFTRTKHSAKKWAAQLIKGGIPAVDLHGNLSQNARERNLAAFSDGSATVLVATDIAARGIHVDDIALVVHVDPPTEHKAYLHRSGRTARAGATGTVVTLMTPDQRGDVQSLMRAAGITPTTSAVVPGSPAIAALRGSR